MEKHYILIAIVMLLSVLPCCGKADGGSHAEIIASPDGSTCYGIFDGDENLKGGNCR